MYIISLQIQPYLELYFLFLSKSIAPHCCTVKYISLITCKVSSGFTLHIIQNKRFQDITITFVPYMSSEIDKTAGMAEETDNDDVVK